MDIQTHSHPFYFSSFNVLAHQIRKLWPVIQSTIVPIQITQTRKIWSPMMSNHMESNYIKPQLAMESNMNSITHTNTKKKKHWVSLPQ
jgi:hypothetical protein